MINIILIFILACYKNYDKANIIRQTNIAEQSRAVEENVKEEIISCMKTGNESRFKELCNKLNDEDIIIYAIENLEHTDKMTNMLNYFIDNQYKKFDNNSINEIDKLFIKYYKEKSIFLCNIIKKLVEKESNSLSSEKYKNIPVLPPLHIATINNDIDMIEHIVNNNKKCLEMEDHLGFHALYYVIEYNNYEAFMKLMQLNYRKDLEYYAIRAKDVLGCDSLITKILIRNISSSKVKPLNDKLSESLKSFISCELITNICGNKNKKIIDLEEEDYAYAIYTVLYKLLNTELTRGTSSEIELKTIDSCNISTTNEEIIHDTFQLRGWESELAGIVEMDDVVDMIQMGGDQILHMGDKEQGVKVKGIKVASIHTGNKYGDIAANIMTSAAIDGATKALMSGNPVVAAEKFLVGMVKGGIKCVITMLMTKEAQETLKHLGQDTIKGLETANAAIKDAFEHKLKDAFEHQVKDAFVNFGNDIKGAFEHQVKDSFVNFGNDLKNKLEQGWDDVKAAFDKNYAWQRNMDRYHARLDNQRNRLNLVNDTINKYNDLINQSKNRIKGYSIDAETRWNSSDDRKSIYKTINVISMSNDQIKNLTGQDIETDIDSDNDLQNARRERNQRLYYLAEAKIKLDFLIKLEYNEKIAKEHRENLTKFLKQAKENLDKETAFNKIKIMRDVLESRYKNHILIKMTETTYKARENKKNNQKVKDSFVNLGNYIKRSKDITRRANHPIDSNKMNLNPQKQDRGNLEINSISLDEETIDSLNDYLNQMSKIATKYYEEDKKKIDDIRNRREKLEKDYSVMLYYNNNNINILDQGRKIKDIKLEKESVDVLNKIHDKLPEEEKQLSDNKKKIDNINSIIEKLERDCPVQLFYNNNDINILDQGRKIKDIKLMKEVDVLNNIFNKLPQKEKQIRENKNKIDNVNSIREKLEKDCSVILFYNNNEINILDQGRKIKDIKLDKEVDILNNVFNKLPQKEKQIRENKKKVDSINNIREKLEKDCSVLLFYNNNGINILDQGRKIKDIKLDREVDILNNIFNKLPQKEIQIRENYRLENERKAKAALENQSNVQDLNINSSLDSVQADPTQVDLAQSDQTQVDQTQVDQTQVDQTQVDQTQVDPTQVDSEQPDPPQVDQIQVDPTQVDQTQVDQ